MRALATCLALLVTLMAPALSAAEPRWIESWGTALPLAPPPPPPFEPRPEPAAGSEPSPPPPGPFVPHPASFSDQTIRMIVRSSAGGPAFRLEFANRHGTAPVTFGSVHAALAGEGGAILAGSDRKVTFGGREQLTLFPGARAVSDPVELPLPALTHIAVSIHLPEETEASTVDALGLMPAYIAEGNQAGAERLDGPILAGSYFWLRGLSVPAAGPEAGTIVALGDSITEGYSTTAGANRSWPDLLAERMQSDPALASWGVVNTGISGNRVLRPGAGDAAVARFTEDVLSRPGVRWVVILESINDINMSIMPGMPPGQAVSAEQIIAGLDQLVSRAHFHGLKVAGGTVMPTKGLPFWSEEGEAMRQAVNQWIRSSERFDAVIDFDAATRDPADPLRIQPELDPGDHVHPNDEGNRVMAEAIDLSIFHPGG